MLSENEVISFKLASLQASATLLAGLAAHGNSDASGAASAYSRDSGATRCVALAKRLFKEATGGGLASKTGSA